MDPSIYAMTTTPDLWRQLSVSYDGGNKRDRQEPATDTQVDFLKALLQKGIV